MKFDNKNTTQPIEGFNCLILNFSFVATNGDPIVQLLICIVTTLTTLTATMANFLVITSIWRTPALHSPSNVLLAGLALSDLCVGLIVQPIFLVNNISGLKGLTDLYCSSTFALSIADIPLCGVSIMTVTVLSLDRYIAIQLHLRYQEIVTVKRAIAVLVSIWITFVVSALFFLWLEVTRFVHAETTIVVFNLTVTGFTYFMIYRVVRRHKAQIRAQLQVQQWRHDGSSANMPQLMKSSWSMFLISFTFGLCSLPYVIIRSGIQNPRKNSLTNSLITASLLLVYINSTINPALYCWRFKKIRNAVAQTIKAVFKRGSNE